MNAIEQHMMQVSKWMRDSGPRFSVRMALRPDCDSQIQSDPSSVRKEILRQLDEPGPWQQKGIYMWFWPRKDDEPAWPLYVGKTEAKSGFRGRHRRDHLPHAANGVDMLCDPDASRKEGILMAFSGCNLDDFSPAHHGKVPRAADCVRGNAMIKQFSELKIVLMPMSDEDLRIIRIAEGLVIAAAERFHADKRNASSGGMSCLMNSKGKASALGVGLRALVEEHQESIDLLSASLDKLMQKDSSHERLNSTE